MKIALVLVGSWAWALSAPVVAQATGAEVGNALDGLLRVGPVGVVLVLVLVGWLVPKPSYDRLAMDLDRAVKQRDDLVAQQATEVLPVLVMVNAKLVPALDASTAADAALRQEVARLAEAVHRLEGMYDGSAGKRGQ